MPTKLYQTYDDQAINDRSVDYRHYKFVQGRRPHYYIDDSYTAAGHVFDTLEIVNTSTLTYTNELGGDGATAVEFPAGDTIYGEFKDANITVAAGGLVRAYTKPR